MGFPAVALLAVLCWEFLPAQCACAPAIAAMRVAHHSARTFSCLLWWSLLYLLFTNQMSLHSYDVVQRWITLADERKSCTYWIIKSCFTSITPRGFWFIKNILFSLLFIYLNYLDNFPVLYVNQYSNYWNFFYFVFGIVVESVYPVLYKRYGAANTFFLFVCKIYEYRTFFWKGFIGY